jgi:hypothetical protein
MIPISNAHPGPSAWNRSKRGTQKQAIGKSRGGLTTKIAALVDALGNPVRFVLLRPASDITSFDVPAGRGPLQWHPR